MSASAEFVEFIHEQLLGIEQLSAAKFFGGHAFKSAGKQFAMIQGNTLYFCVDAQTRSHYESLGMEPFSYETKRGTVKVKKYYAAPESLFDEQEVLLAWAQDAVAAALRYK